MRTRLLHHHCHWEENFTLVTKLTFLAALEMQSTCAPAVDAKLLDGAAIVQMLSWHGTNFSRIFGSSISFLCLTTARRLDIVWDVYIPDSLKGFTRQKRGKGIRRRVAPSTQIPKNCSFVWMKNCSIIYHNKQYIYRLMKER